MLSTVPLATAPPTTAAASAVPTAVPTASADRVATTSPLRRDVRLGHKPLRYDEKRPSVQLTFSGRKGQLVELATWQSWPQDPCVRKSLRSTRGRRVDSWATGYWRLPRKGSYTAVLRPCDDIETPIRVQVRRTVVQDASIDGPATTVGRDPDVTHLVRVPVAAGERLSVRPSRTPRHLVLPDGTVDDELGGWLPLSSPGRYSVAARPGTSVSVSRAQRHTAVLDGSAVALVNAGVAAREHVVSFTARAGQWVYPELLDASGRLVTDGGARTQVLRADGSVVRTHTMTPCPGKPAAEPCSYLVSGPWLVPAADTYEMVVAAGSGASDTFSLRVRSAATAPALTLDGPAVTYTSTTPGQWVVGTYTEGIVGGTAVAHAGQASASLSDWRVSLLAGYPNVCPVRDTSNGCPD
ncbi:hypothetical protein [Nocardioides baculatus]|uniref:Uncharacterized protein n=1 Tax=Nocardioides baculatus TaxID=2801337 RepID=A0ABS1L4Z1_9ACTN|nr:hypothetical protein [Nocardioides baculatus]MBL0746754.1 hypothetical protein [Nocardioides baculatus]